MNYLPDAANFGAEIFTEVSVRYLERSGDGWLVHFQPLGVGREKFGAPRLWSCAADIVILAAGTLGSTEILLRSRLSRDCLLSDQLGHHFTGNGDVLGFGYNTDNAVDGIGLRPHRDARGCQPVGPVLSPASLICASNPS